MVAVRNLTDVTSVKEIAIWIPTVIVVIVEIATALGEMEMIVAEVGNQRVL